MRSLTQWSHEPPTVEAVVAGRKVWRHRAVKGDGSIVILSVYRNRVAVGSLCSSVTEWPGEWLPVATPEEIARLVEEEREACAVEAETFSAFAAEAIRRRGAP